MANMTTASDFRNPASAVTIKDRVQRNHADYIVESLIDDATYDLGLPEAGVYLVYYAQKLGLFVCDGSAILLITDGGTIFDDADTDTKMCLYISTNLILKNRTGTTKTDIRVVRIA